MQCLILFIIPLGYVVGQDVDTTNFFGLKRCRDQFGNDLDTMKYCELKCAASDSLWAPITFGGFSYTIDSSTAASLFQNYQASEISANADFALTNMSGNLANMLDVFNVLTMHQGELTSEVEAFSKSIKLNAVTLEDNMQQLADADRAHGTKTRYETLINERADLTSVVQNFGNHLTIFATDIKKEASSLVHFSAILKENMIKMLDTISTEYPLSLKELGPICNKGIENQDFQAYCGCLGPKFLLPPIVNPSCEEKSKTSSQPILVNRTSTFSDVEYKSTPTCRMLQGNGKKNERC
jgi:hypothetical protein